MPAVTELLWLLQKDSVPENDKKDAVEEFVEESLRLLEQPQDRYAQQNRDMPRAYLVDPCQAITRYSKKIGRNRASDRDSGDQSGCSS